MKLLLLLMLFCSPVFSQSELDYGTRWSGKYTTYLGTTNFKAPNLGVFTRLEGLGDDAMLSTTGLEWMAGGNKYYYGQLRLSARVLGLGVLPEALQGDLSTVNLAILHGMGGYLFDQRTADKHKGWSMVLNGAVGMNVDLPSDFELNIPTANMFSVLAEINTYARYHWTETYSVQFGANVGVDFSLYQNQGSSVRVKTPIRYGLSVGFTL